MRQALDLLQAAREDLTFPARRTPPHTRRHDPTSTRRMPTRARRIARHHCREPFQRAPRPPWYFAVANSTSLRGATRPASTGTFPTPRTSSF